MSTNPTRFATPSPDLDDLVTTRLALHRLASTVIAPVRFRATERFGLIATPGGFGTPRFPQSDGSGDRAIRVEGTDLIDDRNGDVRSAPITSLRAAAEFLDADIDPETAREADSPAVGDVDETLAIVAESSAFLGEWFAVAFAALERVRQAPAAVEPSPPQLWPGHFDPAIESGTERTRGSYGASPGDDGSNEPYLYVSLWYPDEAGIDATHSFWNATAFTGRVLPLSDFPTGKSPTDVAAEFWETTARRLG